jgi:hypothetical protein
MTSALIAPVIPPRAVPGSRPRGRPGIVGTLPLAVVSPEQAPALAADVVYGLGRIDASGRVADRTVTCALGWRGGDRLTLTASAGVVTARRDPARSGHPAAPALHRDPRDPAAPLRPAPRRPRPAGSPAGREHADRVLAGCGGSGPRRAYPVPGT